MLYFPVKVKLNMKMMDCSKVSPEKLHNMLAETSNGNQDSHEEILHKVLPRTWYTLALKEKTFIVKHVHLSGVIF